MEDKTEIDSQREFIRLELVKQVRLLKSDLENSFPGVTADLPSCKTLCDWIANDWAGYGAFSFDEWREVDWDGLAVGVYLESHSELEGILKAGS